MIGYLLEQELGNLLPAGPADGDAPDPDRGRPAPTRRSAIRPSRSARSTTARRPSASPPRRAGRSRPTGAKWRRVVPSPEPQDDPRDRRHRAARPRAGCIVVCAGGGGIPVVAIAGRRVRRDRGGHRQGLRRRAAGDAAPRRRVPDADRRRRGLRRLGHAGGARRSGEATPGRARARRTFAAGSMGPKVEAACRFVRANGGLRRDRLARRRRRGCSAARRARSSGEPGPAPIRARVGGLVAPRPEVPPATMRGCC